MKFKMNLKNFKSYLKDNLIEKDENGFIAYYFKHIDENYKVDKNTKLDSYVYAAKDLAKNEIVLYQLRSIDEIKKYANVISKDYGFSSFYFDALVLVPEEIIKQKHYIDGKDDEQLIEEDKKKRKIKRKL
jgi:hypothetical protein